MRPPKITTRGIVRVLHGAIVTGVLFAACPSPSTVINYDVAPPDTTSSQVAALTKGRHCTPEDEPRLVDHVVVKWIGVDRVTMEPFDTAYRMATNGSVTVVAYCD
jgi:hypothetical protein